MTPSKEKIYQDLHQWFLRGVSVKEATQKNNHFYGFDLIKVRMVQWWFKNFREGRRSGERKRGLGPPVTIEKRRIGQKLRKNPNFSTRRLAIFLFF